MNKDIELIDRVISSKKARDLAIIKAYAEGLTEKEVGACFNLDYSTISKILKPNRALCDEITISLANKKKARRLRVADRHIRRKDGNSRKDLLDWLEYERKEIEGDKNTNISFKDTIITPHAIVFSAVKNECQTRL